MFRAEIWRGDGPWQRVSTPAIDRMATAKRYCRTALDSVHDANCTTFRILDIEGVETVEAISRPPHGKRLAWRVVPFGAAVDGESPEVSCAIAYAKRAHAETGVMRDGTNDPYIVHPIRVMEIVRSVEHDEAMLAAAALHDVVEDTERTQTEIRTCFGPEVAELVGWLTDVSRPEDGNRLLRKAKDREHLAGAPGRAQTIKLADLIDNASDVVEHKPSFAPQYFDEMEVSLTVLTRGDSELRRGAAETIAIGRQGLA